MRLLLFCVATGRCECGTCRRASASTRSQAIPKWSGPWCSSPTGHDWHRAPATRRCEWGTWPAWQNYSAMTAEQPDQTVTFNNDSTKIVVNGASLSIHRIPSQTLFPRTKAGSGQSHSNIPISKLAINNDWVTLSSETILWLPPEHRPGNWASYGDMIIVGSGNGRVTFVRYISTGSSSS